MNPSIWPSLIAFAVVIALIPLALAVVKRAQGLRPKRQGMLNLVGGLSVGPRERIAVVETGGKWLVLGITAQSINLLTTLDECPAGAEPLTAPGTPVASSPFAAVLSVMKKNAQTEPH